MSINPPIPEIQLFQNLTLKTKMSVTWRVQHSIDSHHFSSMSIGPPIPEIQYFQDLTFKIQGQGHG